jgi:glycosyltransferase involved in cell wall biosynthesis
MPYTPKDVSAVVCTLNSIASIERCLMSLREAGVGEVIVVDGGSTDGTTDVAEALADLVLRDKGEGLGAARNIGIAHSTGALILNMGSDNIMPSDQLSTMIATLEENNLAGVSAQTIIEGTNYPTKGLNAWRKGRFRPGPATVIGTPTLFRGDLLRNHPYDPSRRFSDDSELCERWAKTLGASFAISSAYVLETGKTSWEEVRIRCKMYGTSDDEVFRKGRSQGWSVERTLASMTHPLRADLLTPIRNLDIKTTAESLPFLVAFTGMRYLFWMKQASEKRITKKAR